MRFLVYIFPYLYGILLSFGFYFSDLYQDYLWHIFSLLILIFLVFWLTTVKFKNISQEQLVIFLSPLFYLISSFAFYLLVDSWFLKRIVIILVVLGLFVILRALYFFHWKSVKYQPLSLQTQIKYLNLITLFFLTAFLYSLETFLNISIWLNALILFAFLLITVWQLNFLHRRTNKETLYTTIFSLVMTQFFIAVGFLPFMVLVKGFLFFIAYFIFNEFYQGSMRGLWKRKDIIFYGAVGLILLAVVLFTTKWF